MLIGRIGRYNDGLRLFWAEMKRIMKDGEYRQWDMNNDRHGK